MGSTLGILSRSQWADGGRDRLFTVLAIDKKKFTTISHAPKPLNGVTSQLYGRFSYELGTPGTAYDSTTLQSPEQRVQGVNYNHLNNVCRA